MGGMLEILSAADTLPDRGQTPREQSLDATVVRTRKETFACVFSITH